MVVEAVLALVRLAWDVPLTVQGVPVLVALLGLVLLLAAGVLSGLVAAVLVLLLGSVALVDVLLVALAAGVL